jgi:RNA polymerase sigma-70 factor (ECF subfamily)
MIIPSTHASLFLPLQRGEECSRAWGTIHARYQSVILTWCQRRGLSLGGAEDLTQEIWLKLVREIHKYDPAKGRLRSWLKAVVNNALTDYWRRRQNKPERSGVGGTAFLQQMAGFAHPDAADELSGALERQATSTTTEIFGRVRARLHETTWRAFEQTLVDQRPAADVARELGISVAAVYKYTYRVKQMLHEEYRHDHTREPGSDLSQHGDAAAVSE